MAPDETPGPLRLNQEHDARMGAGAADAPADPIEGLQQQARVGRTRTSTVLTPLDRDEIIARAKGFLKNAGLSQGELARMANVTDSVVSQVLKGTYEGNADRVLVAIESAIDQEESRRRVTRQRGAQRFVETQVARDIFTVAKATMDECDIGVIYGPSRIGKSLALEAIQRKYPTAILLQIDDESCSPTGFYEALYKLATRRNRLKSRSKSKMMGALKEVLTGSRRLIILDEAENLRASTLNAVRQLWDATQCPILLVGRPPLWKAIRESNKDPRMGGALLGRLGVRRDLLRRTRHAGGGPGGGGAGGGGEPLFSVEEILAMVASNEVQIARDAARWLCALANLVMINDEREGCGPAYAVRLFRNAVKCLRGAKREVTLELLQRVNASLGDEDYVAQINAEADSFCDRYAELKLA